MRCLYCNKNEAVKSYERIKQGKKREYYCLECYERLFLCDKKEEQNFSACPYCGTTLEEFERRKLVGCSYCYKTIASGLMPTIMKMQNGVCGHKGKKPPIGEEEETLFSQMNFISDAEKDGYRESLEYCASFEKQRKELETLLAYLKNKNAERAAEYKEKLERMNRTGEIEEEIVW